LNAKTKSSHLAEAKAAFCQTLSTPFGMAQIPNPRLRTEVTQKEGEQTATQGRSGAGPVFLARYLPTIIMTWQGNDVKKLARTLFGHPENGGDRIAKLATLRQGMV
jgi:hypothetical protein